MSPQPTERHAASASSQLVQPLRHAWHRLRARANGQHGPHILYLGSEGVLSWSHAVGAATKVQPTRFVDFNAWCAAHAHSDARIFVSGHLLHSLVVDPALNLADDKALRAYAQQQFGHYHGPAARQWPLAVWSHQSKTQFQAGACALHGVDMPALLAAAQTHGVRVSSVSPVWSAGLGSVTARWPTQEGQHSRHAVALIEGALLTWMLLQGGTVLALEQRYFDSPDWPSALRLVAQLSSDGTALSAPPAVVAWGLAPDSSSRPSAHAAVRQLPQHDRHSAMGAWVMDAMDAVNVADEVNAVDSAKAVG